MAFFLLVHGSCHGAWCWRDVIPALAARGHGARAIDLPAHGDDPTPAAEASLDAYAAAIVAALAEAPGPAVLVGHSAGGISISMAAERAPHRIRRLVYLCAYALEDGESLAQVRRRATRQPLLPAIRRGPDGLTFTVDPELAPGIFFHDCPPEAVGYALTRLCPEPIAPQETPLSLTDRSRFLPRTYILCTDDHTIPPEEQRAMTADWPPGSVLHLASGHSPFLACPEALADLLDAAADRTPARGAHRSSREESL
jgi:pimeloyl-ACP methyl ester carboxylesterase